ncbi:MAG: heavy-metal-associated domain-containing protein [archaeon]
MEKIVLKISGMHCNSCVTRVREALEAAGAKEVSIRLAKGGLSEVAFVSGGKPEEIFVKAVEAEGYSIGSHPEKKAPGKVEKSAAIWIVSALALFTLAEFGALFLFFGSSWLVQRAPWVFLLNLSAALSAGTISQLSAYRGEISCMSGMMLGMLAGMQAGLLTGYVLGATNGFFAGALFSTIFGMFFGWLAGRGSGLMGALQGLMSGFMGGAMGAMTSVMMVGYGFEIFTLWFSLANAGIFAGFFPLVVQYVSAGNVEVQKFSGAEFLAHFLSAATFLAAVFVFGPKGLLGW